MFLGWGQSACKAAEEGGQPWWKRILFASKGLRSMIGCVGLLMQCNATQCNGIASGEALLIGG